MKTAGLPTFSKLALRNNVEVMVAGTYEMAIQSCNVHSLANCLTHHLVFPVIESGSTKSILITTTSAIGGKNNFLGILYLTVAGACAVLGILFTARHLIKPR
jgi:hypothetical protein